MDMPTAIAILEDAVTRSPAENVNTRRRDRRHVLVSFRTSPCLIDSSLRFLYVSAPMQRVSIEIPLPTYDSFIEQCEESSREYEVLKNGLILRRPKNHDFERFVKIDCTLEDANKLLLLATKICPDVVLAIAKGITTSLKSD
jgi:hypothetical protein